MPNHNASKGMYVLDGPLARFASAPPLGLPWKFVLALALTALFIGLRLLLGPVLGAVVGFSLLLPAVLLGALGGGLVTALMTMALCSLGMAVIFDMLVPGDTPVNYWGPAISFWAIGLFCAVIGSSLRQSLRSLSVAHTELEGLMGEQRENAAQLKAIFEQASVGIVRTDLQAVIQQANARFLDIVGRAEGDVIGRPVTDFIHPDDIPIARKVLNEVPSRPTSGWQVENRYIRPDGEDVQTLVNIRVLHEDDGPAYGLIGVVADITETRRAKAELSEIRHSLRVAANAIPVPLWMTHPDRSGRFANNAYLAFTGQQLDEVTADDWQNLLHPDDAERVLRTFEKGLASGKSFTMEARYRRHDGQWRWMNSFHQPNHDSQGRFVGIVGTAFDMTESKEAAARIEESEARFRMVANSAPAMIWMVDEQGRTTFGNRRFRAAFSGRTPQRLISAWRDMTHPDDRETLDRILEDAERTHRKFSLLNRINHPIFGERWIRSEAAPRHDTTGRLIGYTGVSLDVTDSQRAERDLKRINELLEERVSAALAEKAKAEADLVRAHRLEAVGRLTGGVAHDFNNLLTVIMGGLDIILRTDDPARRQKLGEAALAAAKRGERLTGQLLAFSRRQTLSPSQTDLNALISEGEPLLHRAVGEGMTLQFKLKRGTAPTLVDPAKFEAALINLLVNARDASPPDGRITVETAEYLVPQARDPELPLGIDHPRARTKRKAALHPGDLAPGRYVRITVSDNGSGMSEEVQRRVFEPFFTTKGVGHGTGLGLSQVYGFTRQSGGSISIQSTVGKGTHIHLFLPWTVAEDARPAAKRTKAVTPAPSSTDSPVQDAMPATAVRLLLVEDDHDVAAIATSLLHAEGFEVDHAANAYEALKKLETQSYEVVLSDILMPGGISGIELAHQIHEGWPELRIVLTSGFPGEAEALKGTPWSFLPKPYTGAQLKAVLDRR